MLHDVIVAGEAERNWVLFEKRAPFADEALLSPRILPSLKSGKWLTTQSPGGVGFFLEFGFEEVALGDFFFGREAPSQ